MALRWNTAKRNALANTGVASIDVLQIYGGDTPITQPTSADDSPTGTLLCTITGIAWGSASSGAVSLSGAPFSGVAVATGTAYWGRFSDDQTTPTLKFDGSVGQQFTLANPSITNGGTVSLTSATLTQPAG